MADQHAHNQPVTVVRQRIVRKLLPANVPTTGTVAPPGLQHTLQPRSAFWRAQTESLRLADASLTQLHKINLGVTDVSDRVGALTFPSALAVTTTMSAADAQALNRMTVAVERVADNLTRPRGECAELAKLTPRGFALIARLNTLAAHMMDRNDVSATSTLQKLDDDQALIADVQALLEDAGLDETTVPFTATFDRDPFAALARSADTDRSPPVFEALQERAALLLAIKCIVATSKLDGEAPDWPPQPPVPPIGIAGSTAL
jgi:hypothetical protein